MSVLQNPQKRTTLIRRHVQSKEAIKWSHVLLASAKIFQILRKPVRQHERRTGPL